MHAPSFRKHQLLLLLAALLVLPALAACDDSSGSNNDSDTSGGDTATGDTSTTPDATTGEDTTGEDATAEDTAGDTTAEDTAGDTTAEDTAGDTTDGDDDAEPLDPAIMAADQTLDDLSTIVVVDSVLSLSRGWVALYADDGSGAIGELLGATAVNEGAGAAIVVELARPAADGETLHAVLHLDAGELGGEFSPATDDVPAVDTNGEQVTDAFVVTVPDGTPAVRFTFEVQQLLAFDRITIQPERFADWIAPSNLDDATLTLQPGWRYEFINLAAGEHPLELIQRDPEFVIGTPEDVVLLTQVGVGDFEADPTVDFVEDSTAGSLRFTLSDSLAGALDGYRCALHASVMRGIIELGSP